MTLLPVEAEVQVKVIGRVPLRVMQLMVTNWFSKRQISVPMVIVSFIIVGGRVGGDGSGGLVLITGGTPKNIRQVNKA